MREQYGIKGHSPADDAGEYEIRTTCGFADWDRHGGESPGNQDQRIHGTATGKRAVSDTITVHDSYTGGGAADCASALSNIACYENGIALPVEKGYIIINRALAAGDKVLLLRVQSGQKFIVLSRVFEGAN